jgi:hypothetical protein
VRGDDNSIIYSTPDTNQFCYNVKVALWSTVVATIESYREMHHRNDCKRYQIARFRAIIQ